MTERMLEQEAYFAYGLARCLCTKASGNNKFIKVVTHLSDLSKKSNSPAPERQGTTSKWRIAAESVVVLWYMTNGTVWE